MEEACTSEHGLAVSFDRDDIDMPISQVVVKLICE